MSAKTIVDAVNGIMSNSWTPNKDAYDMNNDGKVNIADIVIMARTILSLGDDVVSGLESLRSLAMQVDMEVDLLSGITLASGVELNKTEIEYDGQRTEIADPKHFMPEYPGLCTLIFSIKKNEAIGEVKAENLTIMPLDYTAMEVNHIQPVDILPII